MLYLLRKNQMVSKYISEIILGMLIIIVVSLNLIWVSSDKQLGPEFDSKLYIIKTLNQFDAIRARGWNRIDDRIQWLSMEGRPPLYQVMSMPFLVIFGRSMDAGLWVNRLFDVLLLVSVFVTGKLAGNSKSGLLAAALVSVYPPLIQLGRIYRPHFALAACVAFVVWRLLLLIKIRSIINVWILIFSLVFSVYIHPNAVFALGIPVFITMMYVVFFQASVKIPNNVGELTYFFREKLSDNVVLRGFLPGITLAAIIIGAWYLTLGSSLIFELGKVSSEELAEFRGYEIFAPDFYGIKPSFLWYFRTMPYAISLILTVMFLFSLWFAVKRGKFLHMTLVVYFIGAYIVFASLSGMTWMHFAAVLPLVAVITGLWLGEIRDKTVSMFLISLTIIACVFIYSTVTWGVNNVAQYKVARILGSPLDIDGSCIVTDRVFCPQPPSQVNWHIRDILNIAKGDKENECRNSGCSLLVIRRGGQFLQYNFVYYMIIDKNKYSNINIQKIALNAFKIAPFDFNVFLHSEYIVYITQKDNKLDGLAENYDDAAVRFLSDPPVSFEDAHTQLALFEPSNDLQLHLIKRVRPLSIQEAKDTITKMQIDEKFKSGQYQVLAPLYAQAGQFDSALANYLKAIEIKPDDVKLLMGLAGIYDTLGRMEDAAGAYRQVLAIFPQSTDAKQAQAWLDAHP